MLTNYLKIAIRNLLKNKRYSAINISGLAIGLAGFIFILLYVNHETSYDKWDQQLKRVYRLDYQSKGKQTDYSAYHIADLIQANCPAVEKITRIENPRNDVDRLMKTNNKSLYVNRIINADSNFFDLFPMPFLKGKAATVFAQPNSIVLSKALSHKLFSDQNPIGKTIHLKNGFGEDKLYTVTGVLDNIKTPTNLPVNACLYRSKSPHEKANYYQVYTIFLTLRPGVNEAVAEKQIRKIVSFQNAKTPQERAKVAASLKEDPQQGAFLEPLQQMHLHPAMKMDMNNNFEMVLILGMLAVLTILLACINFTNLSIARSVKRAKEVGLRKVLGSRKKAIVLQFIIESFLQCILALFLALILVELITPLLNILLDIKLSLWNNSHTGKLFLQLFIVLLITGILSGTYPAFFLAGYQPSKVLKGNTAKGTKGKFFRNSLIIIQFIVSVVFIVGLLVIYKQINYIKSKDPGFQSAQVIVLNTNLYSTVFEHYDNVKSRLLALNGVSNVSVTSQLPGGELPVNLALHYKGEVVHLRKIAVGFDYFETMDIPIIKGRSFSPNYAMDTMNSIIINEAAAQKFGMSDPIGKQISFRPGFDKYTNRQIVGIAKNVNMLGFKTAAAPMFYALNVNRGGGVPTQILVKVKTREMQHTLSQIKKMWKDIEPGFPLRYVFLDQQFAKIFASYERLGKLFFIFTVLTMLVALMGLFALVSFMAEKRPKEIGIRKVLGASNQDIIALLNKDFVKLIFIANIIAWPITYILGQKWLNGFAYRINMPIMPFVIATVLSVVLTILVVSVQAWRAAKANPVEALKYE